MALHSQPSCLFQRGMLPSESQRGSDWIRIKSVYSNFVVWFEPIFRFFLIASKYESVGLPNKTARACHYEVLFSSVKAPPNRSLLVNWRTMWITLTLHTYSPELFDNRCWERGLRTVHFRIGVRGHSLFLYFKAIQNQRHPQSSLGWLYLIHELSN